MQLCGPMFQGQCLKEGTGNLVACDLHCHWKGLCFKRRRRDLSESVEGCDALSQSHAQEGEGLKDIVALHGTE